MKLIDCEQGSAQWFACRAGKPTASEFSKLVTNTMDADGHYKLSGSISGYAANLAAELFAGKTLDNFDGNTPWMQRGIDSEAEALEWYAFTQDAPMQKVGFISDDAETCGCSPDALVGDDGGLEVKVLRAENHVLVASYFEKHKRAEPKYTQQVQGALWITGRKWWDQLFYSPDLPPIIIRQAPDLKMHAALSLAIRQVCTERDAHLVTLKGATP